MTGLRQVCVYCGSSDVIRARHLEAARAMGCGLASWGHVLIFGSGHWPIPRVRPEVP